MSREKVYCLKCEQMTDYVIQQEEITQKVKEDEFTLTVKVPHCLRCGEEVFVEDVDSESQMLFFEAYRKKHHLISVEEIIRLRKKFGLNQRDFSRLLGLGEITISRYELGSIPNSSSSTLIKNTKQLDFVKKMFDQNKEKMSEDGKKQVNTYLQKHSNSLLTGNVPFNSDKFFELAYFFTKEAESNSQPMYFTKMNKLLYYADFMSFKLFGKGITGSIYLKMPYGPVPKYYDYHYHKNPWVEILVDEEKTTMKTRDHHDFHALTEEDIHLASAIFSYFKNHSSKAISDVSHDENGWIHTEDLKEISYSYAKDMMEIV